MKCLRNNLRGMLVASTISLLFAAAGFAQQEVSPDRFEAVVPQNAQLPGQPHRTSAHQNVQYRNGKKNTVLQRAAAGNKPETAMLNRESAAGHDQIARK